MADPITPTDPTPPAKDPDPTTLPTDPAPAEDPDAGAKKALESERSLRREAEKGRKLLEAELAQLKAAQMSDQEKAIADAVARATAETDAKWRDRYIAKAVAARAAGRVVDADLVAQLIDRSKVAWDGDDIDIEALDGQIEEQVAQRPYLARSTTDPTPPPPPVPNVPGGARGGGEQPDPGSMSMEQFREWRKANA